MPATAVADLADMIDPAIKQRIAARGIQLQHLIDACINGGYQQQLLFEDRHQNKIIKVWR